MLQENRLRNDQVLVLEFNLIPQTRYVCQVMRMAETHESRASPAQAMSASILAVLSR